MKEKLKVILCLICILLLSGCFKSHTVMSINKDKSVNYEMEVLVANSLMEGSEDLSEVSKYEEKGFKVTNVNGDSYSGYKISKSFKNIDEISGDSEKEVLINDISEDSFDESNIFRVKKGFFKNTYYANFKYVLNIADTENTETELQTETMEDNGSLEPTDEMVESEIGNEEDLSNFMNLMGEIELTFTVNLPSKALTNNATSVTNNAKTLLWTIQTSSSNTKIEFSFEMLNMKNIIIAGAIAVGLLLLLIIIIIVIAKKKKSSRETLIYKEYDPNVGSTAENTGVNNISMNTPISNPQEEIKNEDVVASPVEPVIEIDSNSQPRE